MEKKIIYRLIKSLGLDYMLLHFVWKLVIVITVMAENLFVKGSKMSHAAVKETLNPFEIAANR